jgi:hypothetical protein
MPTYCYSTESGIVAELFYPMGKAPGAVTLPNGELAVRDFGAEHGARPAGSGWPMECVASGVNAEQANELRAFFQKSGVPTDVTRDGNPVYTSASHRRAALRVRGLHDRNSFC